MNPAVISCSVGSGKTPQRRPCHFLVHRDWQHNVALCIVAGADGDLMPSSVTGTWYHPQTTIATTVTTIKDSWLPEPRAFGLLFSSHTDLARAFDIPFYRYYSRLRRMSVESAIALAKARPVRWHAATTLLAMCGRAAPKAIRIDESPLGAIERHMTALRETFKADGDSDHAQQQQLRVLRERHATLSLQPVDRTGNRLFGIQFDNRAAQEWAALPVARQRQLKRLVDLRRNTPHLLHDTICAQPAAYRIQLGTTGYALLYLVDDHAKAMLIVAVLSPAGTTDH